MKENSGVADFAPSPPPPPRGPDRVNASDVEETFYWLWPSLEPGLFSIFYQIEMVSS